MHLVVIWDFNGIIAFVFFDKVFLYIGSVKSLKKTCINNPLKKLSWLKDKNYKSDKTRSIRNINEVVKCSMALIDEYNTKMYKNNV